MANNDKIKVFRARERNMYLSLFGNIFRSLYKIDGVSTDENDFAFRLIYTQGKVGASRLVNDVLGEHAPIIFSSFVEVSFNRTNRPAKIKLVNAQNDPYAPKGNLFVDEDATIFYAFMDKMTPGYIIETMVSKLVEVELSIRNNHILTRTNFWLNAKASNTKKNYADLIIDQIENGDLLVLSDSDLEFDANRTQANFVVDKLQLYKKDLISDILTFIGVDNLNSFKKERQLVDEVNANNNLINVYREMYGNRLKEFIKNTNKVFGTNLTLVENIKIESNSIHEEPKEKKEGEEKDEEQN